MIEIGNILPTVLLFSLSGVTRLYHRSWLGPAAFFCLCWSCHVLVSFFFPEYPVWSGALWWIFLTCLVFFLGNIVGGNVGCRGLYSVDNCESQPSALSIVKFYHATTIIIICSIFSSLYFLFAQFGFFDAAYGAEAEVPLPIQVFLIFNHVGPAMAGMILASGSLPKKRLWLPFLTLAPSFLFAIAYTYRSAINLPVLYFLGGYWCVMVVRTRGNYKVFRMSSLIVGVTLLVFLIFTMVALDIYRLKNWHAEDLTEMVSAYEELLNWDGVMRTWSRSKAGLFSHVYSFSHYFSNTWDTEIVPHWGRIMFAAPLDLLGLEGDRYPFPDFEVEPGVRSNIYTMLRAPLDDFGFFGSLIWWFLIGMVQGLAYEKTRNGSIVWATTLIAVYIQTPTIGGLFFRYNSVVAAYAIVPALVVLTGRIATPGKATFEGSGLNCTVTLPSCATEPWLEN